MNPRRTAPHAKQLSLITHSDVPQTSTLPSLSIASSNMAMTYAMPTAMPTDVMPPKENVEAMCTTDENTSTNCALWSICDAVKGEGGREGVCAAV